MVRVDLFNPPSVVADDREHVMGNGHTPQPPLPELCCCVYSDFDSARELEPAWDELVGETCGDLFATLAWCEVWWRHFGDGRILEIHTASAGGELVAVLPLFRETIGWAPLSIRCVKLVGCDHSNTTCSPAIRRPYISLVMAELLAALDRGGPWDVLHLGELPGYLATAPEMAKHLRQAAGRRHVEFDPDFHPQMVFDLPPTYERYLAGLPRKERRNVRHDERELAISQTSYRSPASREDLQRSFDRLIELHAHQWQSRGWVGHFCDFPGVDAFHRDAAECMRRRGQLVMIEAERDGRTIASEYCVRFGRRLHWIIGGRLPETASRVGVCGIVRAAIVRGWHQIDALNGYYDYKRRLGAHVLGLQRITVGPAHWSGGVRLAIVKAAVWATFQLYFRVWYWHLAPWLRTRWPRLRARALRASISGSFLRARFLVRAGKVSRQTVEESDRRVDEHDGNC